MDQDSTVKTMRKKFDLHETIETTVEGFLVFGLKFLKTLWVVLGTPRNAARLLVSDVQRRLYLRPAVFATICSFLYGSTQNVFANLNPRSAGSLITPEAVRFITEFNLSLTGVILNALPMIATLAVAGWAASCLVSTQEIARENFRDVVFYGISGQGMGLLALAAASVLLVSLVENHFVTLARALEYTGSYRTLLAYALLVIFVVILVGPMVYFMFFASMVVGWSGMRALEQQGFPRISKLRKGVVLSLISISGLAYLAVGSIPGRLDILKNPRTHKIAVAKVYVQSGLDTTTMVFDIVVKNPTKETLIFTEGDLAVRTNSKRELTGSVVMSAEIIDSSDGKAKSFAIDPGKAKLVRGEITFDNNELRSYAMQLGKGQNIYRIMIYFVVTLQPFGKGLVVLDKTSWCETNWQQKLPATSSIALGQDVPVVCGQ